MLPCRSSLLHTEHIHALLLPCKIRTVIHKSKIAPAYSAEAICYIGYRNVISIPCAACMVGNANGGKIPVVVSCTARTAIPTIATYRANQ